MTVRKDHIFVSMPEGPALELKNCYVCGQNLPLTEFDMASRNWDNLASRCRQCNLSYNKVWRDEIAKDYRKARRQQEIALKQRVFDMYGRKCAHCGYNDERALCIDHVFGDGKEERAKTKGKLQLLRRVIEKPYRYQILCANCNLIKAKENHELGCQKYRTITESGKLKTEDADIRPERNGQDDVLCNSA